MKKLKPTTLTPCSSDLQAWLIMELLAFEIERGREPTEDERRALILDFEGNVGACSCPDCALYRDALRKAA